MCAKLLLLCLLGLTLLPTEIFSFRTSSSSLFWSSKFKVPNICFEKSSLYHKACSQNYKKQFFALEALSDKEENGNNENTRSSEDDALFESLRKRQSEIQDEVDEIKNRWRTSDFLTTVPLQLDDWVRRITLSRWPIAALGTAGGSIRVADLSTGELLASAMNVHAQTGGDAEFLETMYGDYDGGGVLAVTMLNNVLVSAGREGGIKIWIFDSEQKKLIPQGEVPSLDGIQVSALSLTPDENYDGLTLWVGSFDKKLRRYDIDCSSSPKSLTIKKPSTLEFNTDIVCMSINTEIGLCVCGLADGSIKFISISTSQILSTWKPYENECARSVAIIEGIDEDNENDDQCYVVCGGGDGRMYFRKLAISTDGEISRSPFFEPEQTPKEILPPHGGPVVSIASRKGGIFVTGAHDGSLRIWDFANPNITKPQPRALYNLMGYKVWLGSICIDGEGLRLFSDGCDNSIVLHDFSQHDDSL